MPCKQMVTKSGILPQQSNGRLLPSQCWQDNEKETHDKHVTTLQPQVTTSPHLENGPWNTSTDSTETEPRTFIGFRPRGCMVDVEWQADKPSSCLTHRGPCCNSFILLVSAADGDCCKMALIGLFLLSVPFISAICTRISAKN